MIDIHCYRTVLSHKMHIRYVDKNFRLLPPDVLSRYKNMCYDTTCHIKLMSFKTTHMQYEYHVMFLLPLVTYTNNITNVCALMWTHI